MGTKMKEVLVIDAFMESFYQTIKQELIQDAKHETSEQAQKEIFKSMDKGELCHRCPYPSRAHTIMISY